MVRWSKQQAISFFTVSITVLQEKYFFEKINLIDSNILQQSDLSITNYLFFGSEKLKDDKNNALLTSAIEFIQFTESQIPVVSIINNQLDWHLLYKPFDGIFLPTIKVIDYCVACLIYIFLSLRWLPNNSSNAGMFSYILIFSFKIIFLLSTFLFYMSSWYLSL